MASGRLSFTFGMRGPSVSIDTACSSSLVATHMSLRCMAAHDCVTSVAAGVKLILTPNLSAMFQRAGMLAPDGRCKTLDASADGYVRGEAGGSVVLVRYDFSPSPRGQAKASPLPPWILAVVGGSAVNQDGRSSSLTAPNGPAQQAVMRSALIGASMAAESIGVLQMHGTGEQGGWWLGTRTPAGGRTAAGIQLFNCTQLYCVPSLQFDQVDIGTRDCCRKKLHRNLLSYSLTEFAVHDLSSTSRFYNCVWIFIACTRCRGQLGSQYQGTALLPNVSSLEPKLDSFNFTPL